MRNIFIMLIAIMSVVGCKPKSKSTLEVKTDSSASNKGNNMPDIGDLKNNTTTTVSNWSKEYRNKFLQGCISKASEKVSAADAFSYCNCMTEKVEAKYPVETEVDAKLTEADIESMRVGCNTNATSQTNPDQVNTSGGWSAAEQKEFMDICTPGAAKSMGTGTAADYCDCMLKKLMQEYPNSGEVDKVSKSHMTELAKDCLKK